MEGEGLKATRTEDDSEVNVAILIRIIKPSR